MKKTSNQTTYESILVICIGLLVLYYFYKINWLLHLSLIIGICSIISTFIASKIHDFWLKLSSILALIMPKIILSLVFFLFLTPVALIYRIKNKDNLQLKNNKKSMFSERNHTYSQKDFETTW